MASSIVKVTSHESSGLESLGGTRRGGIETDQENRIYNGTKVLGVHGHVSAPGGGLTTLLVPANTAAAIPITAPGRGGYSDKAF